MALDSKTIAEIQRKAEQGLSLVSATPEKQKLYNQYQETIRKAKNGQQLVSSTPDKQALYDKYANQSKPSAPSYTPSKPSTPSYGGSSSSGNNSYTPPKSSSSSSSSSSRNNSSNSYNPPSYSTGVPDRGQGAMQNYSPPTQNKVAPTPSLPQLPNLSDLKEQFALQSGLYNDKAQANKLLDILNRDYGGSGALIQDGDGWRVQGAFDDYARAQAVQKRLQDRGALGQTAYITQNTGGKAGSDLSYNKYGIDDPRYFQDLPNASANDLAGFNGNNWDEFSGMYAKGPNESVYRPLSHDEAMGVNPLHPVNGNRQSLIKNAVKSGDWTDYRNWSAQQNPLGYDLTEDGNYKQNKNYYADLISSSYDAMIRAQQEGDMEGAQNWQRSLQERVNQYNNAPGMAVYIPRFHSSDIGKQYGIVDYDPNYIESVYNQGSTGFKPHQDTISRWMNDSYSQNPNITKYLQDTLSDGTTGGRTWYDNPYLQQNPDFIDKAIENGILYGNDDQANASWNINQNYYNQPTQNSGQPSQPQQTNQYEQQLQQYLEQMQQQYDQLANQQHNYQPPAQQAPQQPQVDQNAYMKQYQEYVQQMMDWYKQMNEQNVYQQSLNNYYNQRPQGQQSVYSPFI